MENAYIITGTVENGQLIHLDESLPISTKRVSVIVKPVSREGRNGKTLFAWLNQIHERRTKLGITSLSKEEIDSWIKEQRDSWGE